MRKFKQVPTHALCVGTILKAPISDPHNERLKLLAEGIEITSHFIEKLQSRGISFVEISVRDLAVLSAFQPQGRGKKAAPPIDGIRSEHRNDYSDRLDQLVEHPDSLVIGAIVDPFSAHVECPTDCSYADGICHQWAQDHDRSVFGLCDLADEIVNGTFTDVSPLEVLCTDILGKIMQDADAVVCLGSTPYESEYPTRHSIHVATIAMAIAVEIGLGRDQIVDLGIGCLIHDMGMQRSGSQMFQTKSKMSRTVLRHLADHPVHAAELAGGFGDAVSDASKLVAYQLHERGDGSGYPRGSKTGQIHTLSKIGAVADSFVAMLSPRPHRIGLQGHYVMAQLLDEMKAGKYDPSAIRGLLQITSLYPIGSCVELNNGKLGRVIRTGATAFDKPTVEMWSRDNLAGKPAVVNLRLEDSLAIECSIPSLEGAIRFARG